MPDIVAVTGATGFIGRELIKTLTAQGWHVRALTRQTQEPAKDIKWITGSLQDQEVLNELVDGASAVIHCAGQVRGSSQDEFNHTNAIGTENILQASVNTDPCPKFLLISSLAAREPGLSWYAQSKLLGEKATIKYTGILSWTIFRPTAVYGPGDKELSPLFKMTKYGLLPSIGNSKNRISLLHVKDLVSAILAWLDPVNNLPGVYELDDGRPGGYDYQTLANLAEQVWKRSVLVIPVPAVLIQIIAVVNLILSRVFQYSPMLTPGKVREIQHPNWVCDNTPLIQASGWKPGVELVNAMSDAT